MKRQKHYAVITSGISILVLLVLAACSRSFFSSETQTPEPTPPSIDTTPIYPGAQDMKEEFSGSDASASLRDITFHVNDESDKVLNYNQTALEKDGWYTQYVDDKTSDELYYAWQNGQVHEFKVSVKRATANMTEVHLVIRRYTRP